MCSSYPSRLFTILLLFSSFIFFNISLVSGGETLVDGWTPIQNLSDTKVVDIGKFAIARHNFQANTLLVFDKLVNGESQSGVGTKYNVTIAAKDFEGNDTSRNYAAIVLDRPNQDFMHLVSFRGPV